MKKICVFVLLGFIGFNFCTKNPADESNTATGNRAPDIVSMTAVPAVLNINMAGQVDSAVVNVIATDIDDTSLTYTFNADLGNFYAQNGNEITYTPSAEPGDYIVSCSVSDGKNTIVRSVTVSVSQPDPEYEFAPETILINRHLTVLLGPSWDPEYRDQLKAVTLEPYRIAKYELTNIEYYQFVKEGGYDNASWWSDAGWNTKIDSGWTGPMYWGASEPPWLDDPYSHFENTPVHGINFYEAEAYCAWLSANTGLKYTVANSPQWQRAAKGPDPGYKYPWGNEFVDEYMNFIVFNLPELMPVNSITEGQSQDGCFHMVGNIYEYVLPIIDVTEIMPVNKVGKLYEYALPLITFDNKDLIVIYFSCPAMMSEPYFMKRAMTTASWFFHGINGRYYGYGVRVCREY